MFKVGDILKQVYFLNGNEADIVKVTDIVYPSAGVYRGSTLVYHVHWNNKLEGFGDREVYARAKSFVKLPLLKRVLFDPAV